MKVFNWIFSVFCILCLPVYGFQIGAILMCILGIASLPVKAIREKWKVLPAHKVLRPLIIGILFIVFCCMIPTSGDSSDSNNIPETVTENVMETEQSETAEPEITVKETESSKEPTNAEAKTQTETKTETESDEQTKTETETKEEAEKKTETEENKTESVETEQTQPSTEVTLAIADIPAYSGKPYVEINNNIPQFLTTDLTTSSYEYYSDLDSLGRCGTVYACIGQDLMPTEERGAIGSVKPTGWHTVKYDVVDGKYLYNRCHLIGYQLSGENANTKNLITGTRYMNVDGMLPFENMVADYVQETGNHVMYRVTPIFEGDNLLASGVQMEAQSVEDNGEGILFNVYCYNVQPEITIDYATGESNYEGSLTATEEETTGTNDNKNTTNTQTVEETKTETAPTSDTSSSGGAGMVWKSATGSKYHSVNDCGNMNPNTATQLTKEQAEAQGLGQCSKCW